MVVPSQLTGALPQLLADATHEVTYRGMQWDNIGPMSAEQTIATRQ